MKKIIVPFDFSSYSLAALKTAQKLSLKSGAEIICVTVVPSEVDWEKLSESAKLKYPDLLQEYEEAKEVLPDYIKRIAPGKSKITLEIRIGVPNELILRAIDEVKADLAVLGAYGQGYSEGNFIGSTLQKVLRKATCPVLAVKEAMDGNDFRKIIFASDFRPSALQAFDKIKPLLKIFQTSVHLLFVNTPSGFKTTSAMTQAMSELMKGNEDLVFHQHIVNESEAEKGLISFAKTHDMAWLALVSGSKSSSSAYMIGTTETVLFKGDIGILSVKS